MKNHVLRIATWVLALGSAACLSAQQPVATVSPNTLYVTAEGRYEAAPDTALVQFDIAPQEDTPKAAYERASRAAEQVRQLLRNNGIDPKSAEIGFFSLAPVYDWRQPKRKLIAYRVTSAVTLKLKDFEKVGPIVQQLAEVDVTENQSLNYILENLDLAKVKAVEDAYGRAHKEGEALARAGGRALGELSYGSVDTYEQIRTLAPMMTKMRAQAGAAAPMEAVPPTAEFSPQRITVTARVSALFTLK